MREEIAAAVVFLSRLVRQNDDISKEKIDKFSNHLSAILVEKFRNHWYKDKPTKGQGYRCIRINPYEPTDPILEKAAVESGLHIHELLFPVELTLWVDPLDVCCRFGESQGLYCTLAECRDGNLQNRAHTVNIEEMLAKERERHNQQINIVTTRSQGQNSHFNRGLIYGRNANFYNKYQHNYYRNRNDVWENCNKNVKHEVNDGSSDADRESPEHINEIRQQFLNQVNSVIAESTDSDPSSANPTPPLETKLQETKPQVVTPAVVTMATGKPKQQRDKKPNHSNSSPKQSRASKSGKQQNKGKQNASNSGSYPHHQKSSPDSHQWNKSSSNQGRYPRSQ